jgi:tRNA (adenine57-N1/adenine58-N1)-methyltransferase
MGIISHDDIIGQDIGTRLYTTNGQMFLAFLPTLGDYVEEMPHSTQVIYAKDLGAILMYGDIFPGATVLESGLGSGALTMALLRAVGDNGKVITFEIRPELVGKARANIGNMLPNLSNLEIHIKDVYHDIDQTNLDRIILDVPEPWHVVQKAAIALVPGGIFLSYLPTILQVHQLHETLMESPHFELMETIEVFIRPWSVTHRSVRPVHRMVAHTGFITTARKCTPKQTSTVEESDSEANLQSKKTTSEGLGNIDAESAI